MSQSRIQRGTDQTSPESRFLEDARREASRYMASEWGDQRLLRHIEDTIALFRSRKTTKSEKYQLLRELAAVSAVIVVKGDGFAGIPSLVRFAPTYDANGRIVVG